MLEIGDAAPPWWSFLIRTRIGRDFKELVRAENNSKQRDRYRAVLLAMDDIEGDPIAELIGRSPRFVDEWAARYRRGGIAALVPKRQRGLKPKLRVEQ